MSICLCYSTADKVLEQLAKEKHELEPVSGSKLFEFTANSDEAREVLGKYLDGRELPVELLVGKKNERRANKTVVTHFYSGNLPDGAILRIDESLYIVSPEYCLLEHALELNLVNLCMMLGRYLATKTPDKDDMGKAYLRDREPLTSQEDLYAFIAAMKGHHGVAALRAALRWTAEGAASPQETNLQLALTLPSSYGGFGLRMPQMNYEVELEGKALALYSDHESIRIDLAWPESGMGLEYQGREHGETLGEDYARCLAAHDRHYELWYVAKEQLSDPVQMDYIARLVARRTGKSINEDTWPTQSEVSWLLSVLGGQTIPALGTCFSWRNRRDVA